MWPDLKECAVCDNFVKDKSLQWLFPHSFCSFSYSGVYYWIQLNSAFSSAFYDFKTLFLHISHIHFGNVVLFFYLPLQNITLFTKNKGHQYNNGSEKASMRTKEYVPRQNKDYVGGATCWSSDSLFNPCNCSVIFSIE